jgi:predicted phage baseplate assembly protein
LTIHNQAILESLETVKAKIAAIANPLPANGGRTAETIAELTARVYLWFRRTQRAVTLADHEQLARETPGAQLARVTAFANRVPGLACVRAPGHILVVVLPRLPAGRPMPSPGLIQAVQVYLARREVIGTHVHVVAPTYRRVAVRAQVQAYPRVDGVALQRRIVDALNEFFDPLAGGPDGHGWPFGRDVYISEVLHVIDRTPGVDHVLSLDLLIDDGEVVCGDVCIGPTGLVDSGDHTIEVVGDDLCVTR